MAIILPKLSEGDYGVYMQVDGEYQPMYMRITSTQDYEFDKILKFLLSVVFLILIVLIFFVTTIYIIYDIVGIRHGSGYLDYVVLSAEAGMCWVVLYILSNDIHRNCHTLE